MHALTKVNVRHDLELCGENRTVAKKNGWLRQQWCLHHNAPGHATLTLDATAELFVDEAESALPALKATANLKEVLNMRRIEEGAKRMTRAQEDPGKSPTERDISTLCVFVPGNRRPGEEQRDPTTSFADLIVHFSAPLWA